MTLGTCITPQYYPSLDEQDNLNAPYYRTLLYEISDFGDLAHALDVPLVLTINNQCKEVKDDWSGWDNAMYYLLEFAKSHNLLDKIKVIGCGNELDLYWTENGSVPPAFAADITRRAYRIAKNYGVKVASTSLAGPQWTHYLSVMSELLGNDVDYYDMHPYGQRPDGWKNKGWMHGDLRDVITHIQTTTQKSCIVTEYGVKIIDAGNDQEVANFLTASDSCLTSLGVPIACWFAYEDAVGAPGERGPAAFGMKSESGLYRPAWGAFMEVNGQKETLPPIEQWKGKVGHGLLDMMVQDNTTPAQRVSTWLPLGVTPSDVEECYGKNGTRYYWLLNESKGFRQHPN